MLLKKYTTKNTVTKRQMSKWGQMIKKQFVKIKKEC